MDVPACFKWPIEFNPTVRGCACLPKGPTMLWLHATFPAWHALLLCLICSGNHHQHARGECGAAHAGNLVSHHVGHWVCAHDLEDRWRRACQMTYQCSPSSDLTCVKCFKCLRQKPDSFDWETQKFWKVVMQPEAGSTVAAARYVRKSLQV